MHTEKLVTIHGGFAIFGTVEADGTIGAPYSVFEDGVRIKSGLDSLNAAKGWIEDQAEEPTDFERPRPF